MEPAKEMYGLQICSTAGLPSGTIHPILARLENLRWLESRWEDTDPSKAGHPRRRYYRLSEHGAEQAARACRRSRSRCVLPRGERPRYQEEFIGEIYELVEAGASRQQLILYVSRQLNRMFELRAELRRDVRKG